MKLLIRKVVEGIDITDTDIIGQIRLWIADTNQPTDYYILVQDDGLPLSLDSRLDSADFTEQFNPRIQEVFTRAKVRLQDYGKSLRKDFYMSIKIPLTLAQKYQQRIG